MKYKLAWLYPDLLELYGDTGNIVILQRRLAAAGIELQVDQFTVGEPADLAEYDVVFLGGGSDREQQIFYTDLMARKPQMKAAIDSDAVVVCICGGYQLLGREYVDIAGNKISGLGLFDFHTIAAKPRTIGYLVTQAKIDGAEITLTGFENHAGLTYGVETPLGRVLKGTGNNRDDDTEGIAHKNLIGTYLHGPLLARNPQLVDALITKMARRRGDQVELPARRSDFAQQAHDQVMREFGLTP